VKCLLPILGSIILLGGCAGEGTLHRWEYVEMVMASPVRMVLYSKEESVARSSARAAFDRMHEIDSALSDWLPSSESNRLEEASPEWMVISSDLRHALQSSASAWESTDGAFDPTIGPVVELWRETRSSGRLPSRATLDAARERVDFTAVELEGDSARITRSGVELDFGGIGKGIALDAAAMILRENEIDRHLIDFDGEILVGDAPPGMQAWRVSIQPISGEAPLVLAVERVSIATSGALHQFVEIDGTRYSHVIDPRTGMGTTDARQVTVISRKSAALADVLATAGCVLDVRAFEKLVRDNPGDSAVVASVKDGEPVLTTIGNPPALDRDAP